MGEAKDLLKKALASEEERRMLEEVYRAIKSIRFGYVQVIIQDSRVVQLDKLEKLRFFHKEGYREG